jgi:hypothetical protein
MKIPYRQTYEYGWQKVELTGKCKRVTGGPYGDRNYVQIKNKFFGIPMGNMWVDEQDISYFDEVSVVEYTCNCQEKQNNEGTL